ncbi:CAP domain-containing protein [Mesobacillus maritimus]|uniref:CAP domain-containing protein n=1 Tax=Mesobacillus maritimus TaxID=1643336 RepID=UPI00384B3A39
MFNDSALESNQTSKSISDNNAVHKDTEASLAMVSDGSLGTLIGKDVQSLLSELGSPRRKDLSAYGYTWYIYNYDINHYVQVGVLNDKVVTVYAIGNEANVTPFKIGQSFDELVVNHSIESSIPLNEADGSYQFELSSEDLSTRPLVKSGNIYAQLYIDRMTGLLSSVRFLDGQTLVRHQPYEMHYRGELAQVGEPKQDDWERIETGVKLQILDITNVIRYRHKQGILKWEENAALVAYGHSKEMHEANYFSHTSARYGNLSDRLNAANVPFQLAGENIAAHYVDGPAVVEGWLNSQGHRESLLSGEFTHLGVGVYQKYYTQNFIKN